MATKPATPKEYLDSLPNDRKVAVTKICRILKKNLPKGFSEEVSYGMIGYVVPHSIYPKGYHCDTSLPLPFINVASQKNYIALYHMGMYDGELLEWFKEAWTKVSTRKLDMGKCCIRLKKIDEIPYELIAELATKVTLKGWITQYEKALDR